MERPCLQTLLARSPSLIVRPGTLTSQGLIWIRAHLNTASHSTITHRRFVSLALAFRLNWFVRSGSNRIGTIWSHFSNLFPFELLFKNTWVVGLSVVNHKSFIWRSWLFTAFRLHRFYPTWIRWALVLKSSLDKRMSFICVNCHRHRVFALWASISGRKRPSTSPAYGHFFSFYLITCISTLWISSGRHIVL